MLYFNYLPGVLRHSPFYGPSTRRRGLARGLWLCYFLTRVLCVRLVLHSFWWRRERERELYALLCLSSWCLVTVSVLLVGLWCVIVAFPDHTRLLFLKKKNLYPWFKKYAETVGTSFKILLWYGSRRWKWIFLKPVNGTYQCQELSKSKQFRSYVLTVNRRVEVWTGDLPLFFMEHSLTKWNYLWSFMKHSI